MTAMKEGWLVGWS